MKSRVLWMAVAAGATAAVAQAEPTFFAFQNETVYRFTLNGTIDNFGVSARLMGSSLAPDGTIRGTSAILHGGAYPAFSVTDPMGTPSLAQISNVNAGPYAFVTYVGNTCYSVNSAGELLTMDPVTLAEQGAVGDMGLGSGNVGAGYDAANDTFYMINKETNSLYTVNYNNATPALVGGLGLDWFNAGAEFFDGTLYALIQDPSLGLLQLGSINTGTGEFTLLRTVTTYDPNGSPMQVSLAVVPAPAGLALLGLGGVAALRRRR